MNLKKKAITILTIFFLAAGMITGGTVTASAAGAVRNTNVTNPSSGNVLISYEGDFLYVSKDTILARLNEIRYEACSEGVYGLSMSDYVPLRWSSDLEWIAQTRAAEAALYHSHTRPNWSYYESLRYNGVYSDNECLYWGGSVGIMRAIESWYSEKFGGGDTSHYRAIIDPRKRQVAVGGFVPTAGWGAITAEFTPDGNLYEAQTGAVGRYTQILEVANSKVTVSSVSAPSKAHIGIPAQATLRATASFSGSASVGLVGGASWSSSNTGIATVDSTGYVRGVSAGTTTISATYRGNTVSTSVTIEGHTWNGTGVEKEPTCIQEGVGYVSCSYCSVKKEGSEFALAKIPHPYGEWEIRTAPTCTASGSRKKTCNICKDVVVEAVPPLGHDWDRWVVTKRATVNEEGEETRYCKRDSSHFETRTIPKKESEEISVDRIYGSTRFETSLLVADKLKEKLGKDKFDVVILAYGRNYADALAGSYLSNVLSAPILLVDSGKDRINAVQAYIKNNLNAGGTIYLLGGTAVVPDSAVAGLNGYTVTRLWGKDRFETNIAILQEAAKFTGDREILVCSGGGFADSLSAAAVGRPILLVRSNLLDSQKHYLKKLGGNKKFCIIGGEGAVTDWIADELEVYGTVERIGGSTRYETSVNVAKRFFTSPENGVFAFGQDFPDGLCGGALAYASGAPLILTATGRTEFAEAYALEANMLTGMALGGPTLISENSMNAIFRLPLLAEPGENTGEDENTDGKENGNGDETAGGETAAGTENAAADSESAVAVNEAEAVSDEENESAEASSVTETAETADESSPESEVPAETEN